MSDGEEFRPKKQADGAPPVVENPKLPKMAEGPVRPKPIKGKVELMSESPKPDKGGRGRMLPVSSKFRVPRQVAGERPPQEEVKAPVRAPEGYVRLRIRVENGKISVVGAKKVEGPLVSDEKLHGALAYEATVGEKRVAAGSIPDAGVIRSFPHPEGPPEMQVHNVVEVPSYEFNLRLPAVAVSLGTMARMEIAVYRVKGGPPERLIGAKRLTEEFGEEVREVARLKGIRLDALPESVKAELKRALR